MKDKLRLKRVLFFAEAVTLAHAARCVSLANDLYKTGNYTIALAADNKYDEILGTLKYQRIPLHSVSSEYFFNKLSKGLPLYSVSILSDYVNEDIKIIEAFKPDFIIGDFRLSLTISSKLKHVPYAALTNAYWSPYTDITYPIPEIPLTKIFGVKIAQKLFDLLKPVVFIIHSLALNKTLKKFSLPSLAYDMREAYTYADYTLYADIESLIPMKSYPGNHLFIGPVLWSAQIPLPSWWETLSNDKPIIFVTLGSSGDGKILPVIIEALSSMPVIVIGVTAKKNVIEKNYPNVYMEDFLPAADAVKKSDVVICNGGSPMVYQALVEKKAIIGIPYNLDQYLMMSIIKTADKGTIIRSGQVSISAVQTAVKKVLSIKQEDNTFSYDAMKAYRLEKVEALINYATENNRVKAIKI